MGFMETIGDYTEAPGECQTKKLHHAQAPSVRIDRVQGLSQGGHTFGRGELRKLMGLG